MPHLMNCAHSDTGWCLDCVKKLGEENIDLNIQLTAAQASLAIVQGCPLTEAVAKIKESHWGDYWVEMTITKTGFRMRLLCDVAAPNGCVIPRFVDKEEDEENPDKCLKRMANEVKNWSDRDEQG